MIQGGERKKKDFEPFFPELEEVFYVFSFYK